MTSARKIEANRQNAARSTGPRSPEGKAAAALNGVRHGPLSRAALLPGESEADLAEFGRKVRASLAPVGEMELLLADRIVTAGWRLRRLLAVEAVLLGRAGKDAGDAFEHYGREKMAVLSRYEAGVERGLYKALHELQRMQAARRGEAVPPLQAVDATLSVDGVEDRDEGGNVGFAPLPLDTETVAVRATVLDPENPGNTSLPAA